MWKRKEIEIFVEQYCINCKGIEKKIFWLILMGFRIFRILNKRLYLLYLWGGPLFFWKLGDQIFSKTNNFFFFIVVCEIFFFPVSSSCRQFFSCLQKIYLGFFCFCTQIFQDYPLPPPPPPPKKKICTIFLWSTTHNSNPN